MRGKRKGRGVEQRKAVGLVTRGIESSRVGKKRQRGAEETRGEKG